MPIFNMLDQNKNTYVFELSTFALVMTHFIGRSLAVVYYITQLSIFETSIIFK